MLEATTPRLARENIDSERLEMIGDSLLKLVTTIEIFRLFPLKHEGFLTEQREKVVGNLYLINMAVKLGIVKYLRAYPLSYGKQILLIRPPGISFDSLKDFLSLWNQNVITARPRLDDGFDEENPQNFEDEDDEDGVIAKEEEINIQRLCVQAVKREYNASNADSYFQSLYPIHQHEYAGLHYFILIIKYPHSCEAEDTS